MIEAVKVPATENTPAAQDTEVLFTFNASELKYFGLEIKDMIIEGKEIDFDKAARNAKYLAMLNRGFSDMKAGKGATMTFEKLEQFVNA